MSESERIFKSALRMRGEGRLSEARKLLLDAPGSTGQSTELLQLLGVICSELGLLDEAATHLRKAVQTAPKSVSAHFNLGNILLRREDCQDALASFAAALALKPNTPEFLLASADALVKLGREDEAIIRYREATAAAPNLFLAHHNLGRVLFRLARLKEAVKSLQQAVRLAPEDADTLVTLGKALLLLQRSDHAREAFAHALTIEPGQARALTWLIQAKQTLADWSDYDLLNKQLSHCIMQKKQTVSPFTPLVIADDPELHLACARRTAAQYESPKTPPHFPAKPSSHRKLRLAYVSADFRRHATSVLMASFFGEHDREQFEVIGVSMGEADGSPLRERVVAGFDHVIEAKDMSPEAISKKIRAMDVDIAIDLMGYTMLSRAEIFHDRTAPVQVGFLGYPGTTGADVMDYIIVDPFIATERVRRNLAEKPVIMPDCYQVNDRLRPFPETAPSRAECGLPAGGFVFCAFNNPSKITPDVFDVWMRILRRADGSVLWLINKEATGIANLKKEAAARGVSPDRLIFGRSLELDAHLARYRLADLFLDTLPYGGHTTVSDALWMGCPVVTCAGASFAARVAGSLLHTVGLPDLVTENLQDYEALAIRLAGAPEQLTDIRSKLAERRLTTPLFDTARFARNIERAYQEMWRLHQSGEAPREIDLSALAPHAAPTG